MSINKTTKKKIQDEKDRLEAAEKDLHMRMRQQEAIAWLGEYAVSSQNLTAVLNEAVRLVSETLDLEYTKVLELQPGGRELLVVAGVGWQDGVVGQARVPAGPDTHAGYTLISAEPVIVYDLPNEQRFHGHSLLHRHNVVSGLSVVIPGREKPYGILTAHTGQARLFVQHDTRFFSAIAGIIASAVERYRAEEELRRSRDELAIILNGVTEGVTVQDREGRLVYANEAATRVMGFVTPEELLAAPVSDVLDKFEILDEDGGPFPLENLPGRRVVQGSPRASVRLCFRIKATGEERWSIVDSAAVYGGDGQVVQAVNIFRDATELIQNEKQQKLLAEAGALLTSSMQYSVTLANVAKLAVNHLADWCAVHLVSEDGEILPLAVAHRDPSMEALAMELQRRYPPDPRANQGVARVLRTGEAQYFQDIPIDVLEASARDADHLAMIRTLQIRSAIVVPLIAHGRTLGAVTLIWSRRSFQQSEVELVNELARRAALAIENARLFQEAQEVNAELEQRVQIRTSQLEKTIRRLGQEVEERRRTELALKKSETLLQSLFESAPDAILLVDQRGKIVRVNHQVQTLFGYEREALIGMAVERLIPQRVRSAHTGHRASYMHSMTTRTMGAGLNLMALHRDGQEFPVDIMLSPVQLEGSEMIICAVRDMTEQRRLQAELSETHRRLFDSVEAERLAISQELHDGPIQDLYGMALFIESLNSSLEPDQAPDEEFEAARQNLQNIIQSLRDVCGELRPPILTHFGLEKAIRSHLAKLREAHPNLEIEARLMNDGQVLSDRARLALFRVYQNALSNIIRHSGAQHVWLELLLEEGELFFTVRDDGRGFTPPKKWVDLARRGHFGLVGMVERVESLGGTLEIESQPGQGATLRARVPLVNDVVAREKLEE